MKMDKGRGAIQTKLPEQRKTPLMGLGNMSTDSESIFGLMIFFSLPCESSWVRCGLFLKKTVVELNSSSKKSLTFPDKNKFSESTIHNLRIHLFFLFVLKIFLQFSLK